MAVVAGGGLGAASRLCGRTLEDLRHAGCAGTTRGSAWRR
ncbi:hypothetical protein KPATCC21470_1582 [Kitasatospora purpeofusca]